MSWAVRKLYKPCQKQYYIFNNTVPIGEKHFETKYTNNFQISKLSFFLKNWNKIKYLQVPAKANWSLFCFDILIKVLIR